MTRRRCGLLLNYSGHLLPTPAVQPPAWDRAFSRVCRFVCLSLCPRSKRKTAWAINTKLDTHNSIVIARHALTQRSTGQRSRSHGYENRHGRTVDSDACCYGLVLLLPAWVCMSIRLHRLFFGCFPRVASASGLFDWQLCCLTTELTVINCENLPKWCLKFSRSVAVQLNLLIRNRLSC